MSLGNTYDLAPPMGNWKVYTPGLSPNLGLT